jgi:hypothetical protein
LKGHVFKDDEGDFNSRLEKSLGTKTAGSTGKRGLAIIVMQVDVTEAEKNLPGPPLKMRVRVLVIENIVINRSATKGTLQRSSQAALNIFNTLQLSGLGAHTLYGDKSPVAPQTVPEGLSSHMVTLYVQSGMNPVIKPQAVQAELIPGANAMRVQTSTRDSGFLPLAAGSGAGATYATGGVATIPASGAYWQLKVNPLLGKWQADFYANGWPNGITETVIATVQNAAPDLSTWPAGVTVTTGDATPTFTLTCDSPNSTIRYSTDGSYPSPAKTLYTAPVTLPAVGTVIRAAAYVANQPPGDVLEFTVTE